MKRLFLLLFLSIFILKAKAQQTVSIGTSSTNNKAVLWLSSSTKKQGLIIPIVNKVEDIQADADETGMIVYSEIDQKIKYFDGQNWIALSGGANGAPDLDNQSLTISGNTISISKSPGSIKIADTDPSQAGQLLTWNGSKWVTTASTAPIDGQVLTWNATASAWEPKTITGASNYTAGTGINITGTTISNTGDTDGTNDVTTASTAGGDVTGTFSNLQIATNAVSTNELADGSVTDSKISSVSPSKISGPATTGQVLKWSGSAWTPQADNVGPTLGNNQLITSNGTSNIAVNVSGDIAFSAGSMTINNNAVTNTKIASVDASKITTGTLGIARGGTGVTSTPSNGQLLIGNGTGYGLSTLTVGTGINITNGAGTVTIASTALANPMTTTGDIIYSSTNTGTPAKLTGAAGFLKSTGAAAPTWSAVNLNSADVTGTLQTAKGGTGVTATPTNGQLLIGNGTGFALSALTAGSGINITNGGGTVTVSSTALSNPMNATGDIIFSSNGTGTPAKLAGAAGFLKSTGAAAPAWSAINLNSADVSGTLPLANGGTGATTASGGRTNLGFGAAPANGQILIGNAGNYSPGSLTTTTGLTITPGAGTLSISTSGNFGAQNLSTTGTITSGSITSTGTITTPDLDINGVSYTWPGALPGSSTFLSSDNTGTLSWASLPATFSTLNTIPKGNGTTGLIASQIFDTGTKVGIGNTVPDAMLTVGTPLGTGWAIPAITIGGASGGGFEAGSAGFKLSMESGPAFSLSRIASSQTGFGDGVLEILAKNTGFNTTAPKSVVDVAGNVTIGSSYAGTNAAPVNGAIIEGSIGIGTNVPSTKLDVFTPAATDYGITHRNATITMSTYIGTLGGGGVGGSIGTQTNHPFYIYVANSGEKATFLPNGNVGIGTNTPVNTLDVEGGLAVGPTYAGSTVAPTNGAIFEGNVGIGTNSLTEKLTIDNGANTGVSIRSYGSFGGAQSVSRLVFQAATGLFLVPNMSREWTIGSDSNTGTNLDILTRTSSAISPVGEYSFTAGAFIPYNDNQNTLGSTTKRWVTVHAVNGTIQTSDARLKTNIRNLKYGLSEVLQFRPVSYSWKDNADSKKIGLIAQEVQALVPEVVNVGEYLGMNYAELVPVLIKAIQEQQKLIDELTLKVKDSDQSRTELETAKAEIAEIRRLLGMEAKMPAKK